MKNVISHNYSQKQINLKVIRYNFNLNTIDELINCLQEIKKEGYDDVSIDLLDIETDYEGSLESVNLNFQGYLQVLESNDDYIKRLKEEEELSNKTKIKKQKDLEKRELQLLEKLKQKYEK